jgi:ADP-ribose pyrophosphatase
MEKHGDRGNRALPVAIEVVEDRTGSARLDEGFLRLRRLLCRNLREDGSRSEVYPVDLVDREHLDAVAVALYRRGEAGVEVLVRTCLRPGAYFRREREPPAPGGEGSLMVEEIVAGVLEGEDRGLEGVRRRAAIEALEEAGYRVQPERFVHLGAPFYLVPGVLSEKVYPTAADVSGLDREDAPGDGSPLEEGGRVRFLPAREILRAAYAGELEDAKTELCVARLLAWLSAT